MSNDGAKPLGIVDPWRIVDDLRPPSTAKAPAPAPLPPRPNRTPTLVDPDSALQVPGSYELRFAHNSIRIVSTALLEAADAVRLLAQCVRTCLDIPALQAALALAGVGVRSGTFAWHVCDDTQRAAQLSVEGALLTFEHHTLDSGMFALGHVLRLPPAAAPCRRWGIMVMIRA